VKISAKKTGFCRNSPIVFSFFLQISINPEISPNVYKTMEKSATSELGALQSAQIV
jgi:hypothetical protein